MLVKERSNKIQSVINTEINNFTLNHKLWISPNHYCIQSNLLNECLLKLFKEIDLWTGLRLNRHKKNFLNFRSYFVNAKNWWDQHKKNIYSDYYWIKILYEITNHVNNSANYHYGNNSMFNKSKKAYSKCLLLKV